MIAHRKYSHDKWYKYIVQNVVVICEPRSYQDSVFQADFYPNSESVARIIKE